MPDPTKTTPADTTQALARLRTTHDRMKEELHRVIVGQDEVIDELLMAVLSRAATASWWACPGWPRRS